jgi:gamma-glutamylcyclotransferase (GGCT)/AIG2-like uncharacterized protein YtfP
MLPNSRPKTLCDYSWSTIRDRAAYTPDWTDLNHSKQSKFLVFITGNLRRGRRSNSILKDSDYYGTGITLNDNFMLKRPVQGSAEPLLLQLPLNKCDKIWDNIHMVHNHMNHVEGDVYALTPNLIAQLDEYEENTVSVDRVRNYVRMVDQPKLFRSEQMFMWVTKTDEYINHVKQNNIALSCSIRSRTIKD